ncbi:MAG: hypothetical protein KBA86_01415 [Bacteroidales bacterium]|nr:hypothetical protein [Bacteroidales bacterium]
MKKLVLLITACILLISCNNTVKEDAKEESAVNQSEINTNASTAKQYFAIKSAYVKYRNNAVGQEMIREWWFDQYGNQQYEVTTMNIMGNEIANYSLIVDGYKYSWDADATTGRKMKFYQSVTDYDKITEKDIENYGIKKHGYEEILGKKCLKVSTEKPAKSTTWMWNNIPLKTEVAFGKSAVLMEAIEISTDNVDSKRFELPSNITFTEVE